MVRPYLVRASVWKRLISRLGRKRAERGQPGLRRLATPSVCWRGVRMLRYITSTLSACALAGTVSAFAQQAPQPQAPQAPKAEEPKPTLTVCVMEAKTTDGATAYILDNTEGGTAKVYL